MEFIQVLSNGKDINLKVMSSDFLIGTDEHNVNLWVEKMKESDCNPVLLYKKRNEEYLGLGFRHCFLALMTVFQKTIVHQFNYDRVCVDTINKINNHGFCLVTLVIANQYEEGIPLAFCITSELNESVLHTFFTCIKNTVPTLKTLIFIGDDEPMFYDAWESVFEPCEECFLCSWHVRSVWNEHLIQADIKKKLELLQMSLKALMYESDEDEFNNKLEMFVLELNNWDVSKEFYEYFMMYYYGRSQMWAYCFRTNAKINTPLHIESLHNTLKQLCFENNKPLRVDDCIIKLLTLANDKKFTDLIESQKQVMIEVTPNISNTLDEENVQWEIVSESGNSYLVIKDHVCNAECNKSCSSNLFKCTCKDSTSYPCKHIDFMLQYTQGDNPDFSTNNNIIIDSDIVDELPLSSSISSNESISIEVIKNRLYNICRQLNTIQNIDDSTMQQIKMHLNAIERLLKPFLPKTI